MFSPSDFVVVFWDFSCRRVCEQPKWPLQHIGEHRFYISYLNLKEKIPNNNSTTAVKFPQSERYSASITDIGSRYRNLYELLLINLNCLFKLNNICFCCLSCRCPPFRFFLLLFKLLKLFIAA